MRLCKWKFDWVFITLGRANIDVEIRLLYKKKNTGVLGNADTAVFWQRLQWHLVPLHRCVCVYVWVKKELWSVWSCTSSTIASQSWIAGYSEILCDFKDRVPRPPAGSLAVCLPARGILPHLEWWNEAEMKFNVGAERPVSFPGSVFAWVSCPQMLFSVFAAVLLWLLVKHPGWLLRPGSCPAGFQNPSLSGQLTLSHHSLPDPSVRLWVVLGSFMSPPSEPRLKQIKVCSSRCFLSNIILPLLIQMQRSKPCIKRAECHRSQFGHELMWFYCSFPVMTTNLAITKDVDSIDIKNWRKRTHREHDSFHECPHKHEPVHSFDLQPLIITKQLA